MTADERSRRALSLFDELVDRDALARQAALSRVGTEDAELAREVTALLEADAAAVRRDDGLLVLRSRQAPDGSAAIVLDSLAPGTVTGWAAYPAGVAWA